MSKTNYSVAVLAGDGIGPEVMAAAEQVLDDDIFWEDVEFFRIFNKK